MCLCVCGKGKINSFVQFIALKKDIQLQITIEWYNICQVMSKTELCTANSLHIVLCIVNAFPCVFIKLHNLSQLECIKLEQL